MTKADQSFEGDVPEVAAHGKKTAVTPDIQKHGGETLHEVVAALGCSELQFREIVERSTDVVLIHSEGRIVYANPAAAWVFGAASAMFMLGRVPMTLVHPSDQAAARERILRATTTNAAVEPQEVRCVRDDRSDLRMENIALPMTSEGRPSIVVVGRDITARRQDRRLSENSA